MKQELTATVQVIIDNEIKPIEDLTDNELEKLRNNMKSRLSSSMSLYFTQHPEEYSMIKEVTR